MLHHVKLPHDGAKQRYWRPYCQRITPTQELVLDLYMLAGKGPLPSFSLDVLTCGMVVTTSQTTLPHHSIQRLHVLEHTGALFLVATML